MQKGFGDLAIFLRDGIWVDGTRVLPEGWVEYSKTGSAANPGYGRHWRLDSGDYSTVAPPRCLFARAVLWLNLPTDAVPSFRVAVIAGRDMFFATGFRNENVYVFQSRRLVVTRHAMPQPIFFGWSQNAFLDSLLACFPSVDNSTAATHAGGH